MIKMSWAGLEGSEPCYCGFCSLRQVSICVSVCSNLVWDFHQHPAAIQPHCLSPAHAVDAPHPASLALQPAFGLLQQTDGGWHIGAVNPQSHFVTAALWLHPAAVGQIDCDEGVKSLIKEIKRGMLSLCVDIRILDNVSNSLSIWNAN